LSPKRGYRKVMAARRRLVLFQDRTAEQGYEQPEERYQVAQDKQDLEAAVDRMVDGAIERAMLGD